MQVRGDQIVNVTTYFDTIEITDFWTRVMPTS
jgi:hypothetical protein